MAPVGNDKVDRKVNKSFPLEIILNFQKIGES